jgi:hypothetical protein
MNATTGKVYQIDSEGRLVLPKEFANSTVLVEQVSDVELVIRKARVVPLLPGEESWPEHQRIVLSDRDRDLVISLLENPPPPNEALRKLMAGKLPPKPAE